MLANLKDPVKEKNKKGDTIVLITAVVLLSLLSFAAGYLTAKLGEREPLRFEEAGEPF